MLKSQQGVTDTPLAHSLPQTLILTLCFQHNDVYRQPYSALQGAVQGRATISLLVNRSVSYDTMSPPLCLDRPTQPRRGCFVREGGDCQTTWAPLQSGERELPWVLHITLQEKRNFEDACFHMFHIKNNNVRYVWLKEQGVNEKWHSL